ncbi:hypothetical protein [Chelativorans sp. AA-79]|uniref:hypothetical protein n=1 Tax=Chelativorans sp. AA-79 TaxID=3028735 RepID=UPI0023F94BE1|nr:hypothetical protein [Chelativorans sp. AA-79]WEX09040.1 hypothetical protein PVE73_23830 [Chelativorans sp. AA-79]
MADSRTIVVAGPIADARQHAYEFAMREVGMKCHFASYDEAPALFEGAKVAAGLITLPASTAGTPFDSLEPADFEAGLHADLHGRFATAQACVRASGQDGCSIVHLVEADGLIGGQEKGLCGIGTMAAVGLSRSIALDNRGKPMRSNVVALTGAERPAELAAFLRFLMFEGGCTFTGQVFALGDATVYICGQPRPLRVAHRDGGWSQADLSALMDQAWESALVSTKETAAKVFSL